MRIIIGILSGLFIIGLVVGGVCCAKLETIRPGYVGVSVAKCGSNTQGTGVKKDPIPAGYYWRELVCEEVLSYPTSIQTLILDQGSHGRQRARRFHHGQRLRGPSDQCGHINVVHIGRCQGAASVHQLPRIKKNRSLYFGPYPSATSLRETLKLIRRLFPIRTCLDTKFTNRLRPCINYEMGRCLGPCCDKTGPAQYREVVNQVRMFHEGKNRDLVERLEKRMEGESERLNFEAAAKIRDQIQHIETVIEKQKIVSGDFVDQDVICFHRQNHTGIVHPLFVRAGKLLGGKGFTFPSSGLPDEEILSSFLHQYYHEGKYIPEQILLPKGVPEQNLIEERLADVKGKKVRILVPVRGDRKHLLQMASENSEKYLHSEAELERDQRKMLEGLKETLHLRRSPRRIEAFDISNFQGGHAVGSMVSFEDGSPNKEGYRHFKIKTVEGRCCQSCGARRAC